MNLDKFISETLLSIIRGVKTAQTGAESMGGIVAPDFDQATDREAAIALHFGDGLIYAYEIDFDIAVAASTGNEAGASAGISVLSIDFLKGSAKATEQKSNTSRIKFRIPIILPEHPSEKLQKDRAERRRKAKQEIDTAYGRRGIV